MTEPQKKPARSRAERAAALKKAEKEAREKRQALERKLRGKERSDKHKADTRRKILIGSWLLDALDRNDPEDVAGLLELIRTRTLPRDYKVMAPLYKELSGQDLPPPPEERTARS